MAERPIPLTNKNRASALAGRLGMTRESLDELIEHTHTEYAGVPQLPTEPRPEVPIERAAGTLPPAPEPSTPSIKREGTKPLSDGFIAAMFLVLLIGLAIAAFFKQGCFERREANTSSQPVDTISAMMKQATKQASSPPVPPTQVAPGQVPPEALVVPQEEPPRTTGPPSHSGITTEAQALRAEAKPVPKPVLVTPSDFAAEEELAKLHANGNSHAYMSAVHRRSGVSYRVYEHR